MPIVLPGYPAAPLDAPPLFALGDGSYNGLTWGLNQPVRVAHMEGLDDLPDIRSGDTPRGGDHGMWGSNDYAGERIVTVTLAMVAPDQATYTALLRQMWQALQPSINTDLPMYVNNNTRLVYCRPRRRAVKQVMGGRSTVATVIAEMHCRDPRVYDATLQTLSTGLPSASGGAPWPHVWPVSWGPAGSGGSLTVTNAGDFPTRPIITITGPVDNPTISNVTAGMSLTFLTSLLTGDTLVIDLDKRSVVVNGTASRRNTITTDSRWWELAPGTSTITYRANTTATGSTLTVALRSAWI